MDARPAARLRAQPRLLLAGLPYLDKINFEIGQEPLVALLRLQKGEVDIVGDGIPPAKFLEVMNDPEQQGPDRRPATSSRPSYVTMNVNMKPLDDVRVRQAINMAINKDRIVKIINGRAVAAIQPLPPLMPGYDKDYKGYPYDVEKAKALLKEAGLTDGFATELYVMNTDPNPRIAQAIQQDLAAIGIKAEIKSLDQANVIAAGGTEDQAADDLVGRHGLDRRLPRSVRLLRADPRLRRRGRRAAGTGRGTATRTSRTEAAKADAMVEAGAEGRALTRCGAQIFADIMTRTRPGCRSSTKQRYTIHSARIGGDDALFVDPVHIPVNYNDVYATDAQ